MRHRILMSLEVDAADFNQAYEYAIELKKLLQSPMVKMAVEGNGIRLSEDGNITVYEPQPDLQAVNYR